jgi:3-hydroxy-D-aspartate aldolase
MQFDRRMFLTAAGAGLLAQDGLSISATAQTALAPGNLTKAELPTPALLVDLDLFEANLNKMAEHCRQAGCSFRPHAKTHKCPEIAKRQVAAGALGICVATVPEAESMVAAGVPGVLLTSPIVEPGKIARMVRLAKSGDVMLAIGHPRQAELLSAAAEEGQVTVSVLVDVDVGDRRTGILPGEPALELARLIARSKRLRLRGVQAYSGSSSHTLGFEAREKASREAMNQAVRTRELFDRSGLKTEILSGGSTGTYNIDSQIKGVTELQVGSFIFMDVGYRKIGGRGGEAVYTDFHPSLTVLSTVVSATHSDRVTIDGGIKAFATDSPGHPEVKGRDGLAYNRFGDEFGALTAPTGATLPKIGDRLEFIVPHCDPTVNLYDRIYAVRGDRVEGIWPVAARREFVPAKSVG